MYGSSCHCTKEAALYNKSYVMPKLRARTKYVLHQTLHPSHGHPDLAAIAQKKQCYPPRMANLNIVFGTKKVIIILIIIVRIMKWPVVVLVIVLLGVGRCPSFSGESGTTKMKHVFMPTVGLVCVFYSWVLRILAG
jgi:hypothetical protein